jgi:hypothetical protein
MKNAVNQSLDHDEVVWFHLLQFVILGFKVLKEQVSP